MTSAPRSASCSVPQGPAPYCSIATTRTSASGSKGHLRQTLGVLGLGDVEDDVPRPRLEVLADARRALLRRAGHAVAVDDVLAEIPRVAPPQVVVEVTLVADVRGHRHGRHDVLRQLREPLLEAPWGDPDRDPAVAEHRGAPDRWRRAAADPDGRAAGLRRSRLDLDVREREEAAGEGGAAAEQVPQGANRLVRARSALAPVDADRLEVLLSLAADADPQDQPATGDVVQRGERLRDHARMAQRKEHDTGPDREARARRGERRERDHDVDDRVTVGDVLAGPDRVVAELLRRLRGLARASRVGRAAIDLLPASLDAEGDARDRSFFGSAGCRLLAPAHGEARRSRQARS